MTWLPPDALRLSIEKSQDDSWACSCVHRGVVSNRYAYALSAVMNGGRPPSHARQIRPPMQSFVMRPRAGPKRTSHPHARQLCHAVSAHGTRVQETLSKPIAGVLGIALLKVSPIRVPCVDTVDVHRGRGGLFFCQKKASGPRGVLLGDCQRISAISVLWIGTTALGIRISAS